MKYIRLPYLTNTYPQTGNYITSGVDKSALYGIYADVNKVEFTIPDISKINVVDNTRFRSIIAIYKDKTDATPKYYTSEFYSRDLDAAKVEANPYLTNYSIEPSAVLKVYVSDIIQNIKKFREEELKLGVLFARNNFLLYGSVGLVNKTEEQTPADSTSLQKQSSLLGSKIQQFEVALLTADANTQLKRGLFYGPNRRKAVLEIAGEVFETPKALWNDTAKQREYIKNEVSKRISVLKAEKEKIDNEIEQSIKNKFSFSKSKKQIVLDETKVDKDIKKLIGGIFKLGAKTESDIIEVDGGFVDCVYLVRFIDWILSPPTLEEIETNGVIKAEDLSVFKIKDEIPNSSTNENGEVVNPTPNPEDRNKKNYYTYQIIRLSIPASLEQSGMTFINQFGQQQTIQTDRYGVVGEYCIEENSFGGNYNLYQRMQLAPCNDNNTSQTGGQREYIRGGNPDYYNERLGNTQYIDYNRDNRAIE